MTLALMFLAMLALGILLLGRVSRISRAEDDGINARVRKITGAPRVLRDDSSLGLYCELEPESSAREMSIKRKVEVSNG